MYSIWYMYVVLVGWRDWLWHSYRYHSNFITDLWYLCKTCHLFIMAYLHTVIVIIIHPLRIILVTGSIVKSHALLFLSRYRISSLVIIRLENLLRKPMKLYFCICCWTRISSCQPIIKAKWAPETSCPLYEYIVSLQLFI